MLIKLPLWTNFTKLSAPRKKMLAHGIWQKICRLPFNIINIVFWLKFGQHLPKIYQIRLPTAVRQKSFSFYLHKNSGKMLVKLTPRDSPASLSLLFIAQTFLQYWSKVQKKGKKLLYLFSGAEKLILANEYFSIRTYR